MGDPNVFGKEVAIRSLSVGLIAIATFAAAGLLLKRRRIDPLQLKGRKNRIKRERLYAAGM